MVLTKAWGSGFTPGHAKQILVGALILSAAATVATWDVYDKGFWGAKGLGTISDYEELESMRTQPVDIHVHDTNEFTDQFGWSDDGIVPTAAWLDWVIYQPGQQVIIDFADANGHQDAGNGMNAAQDSTVLTDQDVWSSSGTFTITEDPVHFPEGHHESVDKITTDIVCEHRAEERKINDVKTETMISSKMTVYNSNNNIVSEFTNCAGDSPELPVGTYTYQMDVEITGPLALNDTMMKEINLEIAAFQPLLLWSSSAPASLEGKTVNLSNGAEMALGGTNYGEVNNPSYHMNPKSLDAKLIYAMFIPCLTFGAMVFILLRSMARGYEFEMNKCYGCDLCDDACPVRLFNGGDKLNIIYNSWNNEDDGVPLYSCLTCTACTNACPQLVDYDSYVDIRRGLIVGGPQAEIPHTVLQAVLAAEAEEEADSDFISVEDYPVESNIGYYPGCVDYLDQEMVFSHVNEGDMNLGDATTSAFTIFDEIGVDVSYLGRDFLKCCGHDQKWQGLTEVFDKLKAYNQKKIQQSGIDTLVSSCAECFRTFARDYELEDVKVMHTTEFLIEQGFDMNLKVEEETTVTYHDPCRLGRQMGVYDEPRELIQSVEGVSIVEMEHSGEDAMCCGVSSMMSCNENARALRVARMEEIKSTGADTMLTSCPKCVSHFECLKFEGDERYSDIKILDVVSFLAQQINEKKEKIGQDSVKTVETEA